MNADVFVSAVPADVDISAIHAGAEMLGFDVKPQGLEIAKVCQARREDGRPLYRRVGIQVPRRAAKTTSTTMLALARMASIPDYRILSTAQTGWIARSVWREAVDLLELHYADTDEEDRPYRVRIANGTEVLTWNNGSTWRPVTPSPLSYRSKAADLLIFEEAGHIAPDLAAELRAGAFPTMDTRPQGQVWIIGTPGKQRAGLLWDALVAARAGKPGAGAVDYSIGDAASITHEDGSLDVDLLEAVHPGLAWGLTDLETMVERFEEMPLHEFAAEYAGQWPADASTGAFDMDAWGRSAGPHLPPPDRFGLAYDVAPDGSSAAVCVAWRDDAGVAHVGVLAHRAGVSWVAPFLRTTATKYKVPIRYDGIGSNHGPAQELDRLRGTKTISGSIRESMGALQRLVSVLEDGQLQHMDQGSLTSAAEGAVWRQVEGGRLLGRRTSNADVSPIIAAALALWQFDQAPAKQTVKIRRAA